MKAILTLFLLFVSVLVFSQKFYLVQDSADFTVTFVKDSTEADAWIFITYYAGDAKDECDCFWKIIKNKRRADYTLKIVQPNQTHDFKVYYVVDDYHAKMISEFLKPGLKEYLVNKKMLE